MSWFLVAFSLSRTDDYGRPRIERVRPHRQGEQVGVVPPQVLQVGQPLGDEQQVGPLDVAGQVQ